MKYLLHRFMTVFDARYTMQIQIMHILIDVSFFRPRTTRPDSTRQTFIEDRFSRLEARFTSWCERLADDLRKEAQERYDADTRMEKAFDLLQMDYRSFASEATTNLLDSSRRVKEFESALSVADGRLKSSVDENKALLDALRSDVSTALESVRRDVSSSLDANKTELGAKVEGEVQGAKEEAAASAAALRGELTALQSALQSLSDVDARLKSVEASAVTAGGLDEKFTALQAELRAEIDRAVSELQSKTSAAFAQLQDTLSQQDDLMRSSVHELQSGTRSADAAFVSQAGQIAEGLRLLDEKTGALEQKTGALEQRTDRLAQSQISQGARLGELVGFFNTASENAESLRAYVDETVAFVGSGVGGVRDQIAAILGDLDVVAEHSLGVKEKLARHRKELQHHQRALDKLEQVTQPGCGKKTFCCSKPFVLSDGPERSAPSLPVQVFKPTRTAAALAAAGDTAPPLPGARVFRSMPRLTYAEWSLTGEPRPAEEVEAEETSAPAVRASAASTSAVTPGEATAPPKNVESTPSEPRPAPKRVLSISRAVPQSVTPSTTAPAADPAPAPAPVNLSSAVPQMDRQASEASPWVSERAVGGAETPRSSGRASVDMFDRETQWEQFVAEHPDKPGQFVKYYYNHARGESTYDLPPEYRPFLESRGLLRPSSRIGRPSASGSARRPSASLATAATAPIAPSPAPRPLELPPSRAKAPPARSPSPDPQTTGAMRALSGTRASPSSAAQPSPQLQSPSTSPLAAHPDPGQDGSAAGDLWASAERSTGWVCAQAEHPDIPGALVMYFWHEDRGVSQYEVPPELRAAVEQKSGRSFEAALEQRFGVAPAAPKEMSPRAAAAGVRSSMLLPAAAAAGTGAGLGTDSAQLAL